MLISSPGLDEQSIRALATMRGDLPPDPQPLEGHDSNIDDASAAPVDDDNDSAWGDDMEDGVEVDDESMRELMEFTYVHFPLSFANKLNISPQDSFPQSR